MSMRDDIYKELMPRLIADYGFKDKGQWLQLGKCPACEKREFFTRKENPWTLKCGRANKCGQEYSVKELYPEIFDHWSNRYKPTAESPNAAADAYLSYSRRLSLIGIKGWYTQELYKDYDRNITSATVRFALPGGSYWERLIDQPSRFDRKAYFKKGGSYTGHCWMAGDQGFDVLAAADRLWIVEGIFDALSWRQAGEFSVSAMSCNNYPEHFLSALKKAIAEKGTRGPELIFAFDAGKAGAEYTKKFVERATAEGWRATAAQPQPEGAKETHDWNDLLGRDRLKPDHLDNYLWNGKILLADSASEKAVLLWEKHDWPNFSFIHDSRTWWASIDAAKVKELVDKDGVSEKYAARSCIEVVQVSNCAFRVLYFQTDETTGESHYYLSIDLNGTDHTYRSKFAPGALVAGSEFKKSLMGAAPGALWEGSTRQLDRLISQQTPGLKTVETLDYTGYSKEHGAYIFGDLAVHNGKVLKVNDEDFFDLGKKQVKLRSPIRMLRNDYDAENFDSSWLEPLFTAWRGNGIATLTFWVMAFFAEQIRKEFASLGYFEMSGAANTGKSTMILFLWKLTGLINDSYEGIDPSKSTMVGYIRTLSRAANLPVVFVESDRKDDAPHAKRFDWDEIKGLFNGQIGRATGKKSQGNDTYEPPFRGALIIEQNLPVNSDEPVLSRIMPTLWTKEGWSAATKSAAEKIEKWPRESVSGVLIHIAKREAVYLKVFKEAFAKHEKTLIDLKVRHSRVRKCHAQLKAGLDALAAVMKIPAHMVEEGHSHINRMAQARDASIESDHVTVAKFWEIFEYLESDTRVREADGEIKGLNHARDSGLIAVNLLQFEQAVKRAGIVAPSTDELKKHLKSSRSHPFVDIKPVNSRLTEKATHCWVFRSEPLTKKGH